MNLEPFMTETAKPKRVCKIPGCGRKHFGRGWCGTHYARFLRGEPIDTPIQKRIKKGQARPPCSALGCARPVGTMGLCFAHYRRKQTNRLDDWERPIEPRRPRGTTSTISSTVNKETTSLLDAEAKRLGVQRAELLRLVVEQWARGIQLRDRFKAGAS